MSQEWMLDLLSDLRGVAEKNAMFELCEHLDDALVIAAREIRAASACINDASIADDVGAEFSRSAGEHDFS